jgi:hypothetical protein
MLARFSCHGASPHVKRLLKQTQTTTIPSRVRLFELISVKWVAGTKRLTGLYSTQEVLSQIRLQLHLPPTELRHLRDYRPQRLQPLKNWIPEAESIVITISVASVWATVIRYVVWIIVVVL